MRLSRLMPIGSACSFVYHERREGIFTVRLRQLGHPTELRGATTDIPCFEKIFMSQEYRSPFDINPKLIVDAGANTGLSALYFAATYPDAIIFAIEPEIGNFWLLEKNCAKVNRIKSLRGALWSAAGCVPLTNRVDGGAWSFTIGQNAQATLDTVNAYPVTQLLEMAGRNQIDILKLDIEGSERELFSKNTDWLDHVSVIIIELHDRFQPGCAKAVYQKLVECRFHQEVRGENILIGLD